MRQLAEGKAYGGGSGFLKGGLPRDVVQAGVWGAGSPFGEEGALSEGAVEGGRRSSSPGLEPDAEQKGGQACKESFLE